VDEALLLPLLLLLLTLQLEQAGGVQTMLAAGPPGPADRVWSRPCL